RRAAGPARRISRVAFLAAFRLAGLMGVSLRRSPPRATRHRCPPSAYTWSYATFFTPGSVTLSHRRDHLRERRMGPLRYRASEMLGGMDYAPGLWHDFAVTVGGLAGALTGLLF